MLIALQRYVTSSLVQVSTQQTVARKNSTEVTEFEAFNTSNQVRKEISANDRLRHVVSEHVLESADFIANLSGILSVTGYIIASGNFSCTRYMSDALINCSPLLRTSCNL
jgi:hypothetical protein